MFVVITLTSVVALFIALTSVRHSELGVKSSYFSWLQEKIGPFFKNPLHGPRSLWEKTVGLPQPAAGKWALPSFVVSAALLVVTGFGYALLSRRGLHGFPLLLHVLAGGVYAVSLSLVVILHAGRFGFLTKSLASGIGLSNLGSVSLPRSTLQKILFWLFVLGGLLLIVSALGSMVPFFSFRSGRAIFEVHRYSALGSLLAGISFFYLFLPGHQDR